LIRYYTDYVNQPSKAVMIAEMQVKQRRDVHSLESYAWALYRNSRFAEAKTQIAKALEVGVLEPRMLYRAAMIYAKAGDRKQSDTLLQKAKGAHPDPVLLAEIARTPNTRIASRQFF
jgi:Flp pilus assembly protein TadD